MQLDAMIKSKEVLGLKYFVSKKKKKKQVLFRQVKWSGEFNLIDLCDLFRIEVPWLIQIELSCLKT